MDRQTHDDPLWLKATHPVAAGEGLLWAGAHFSPVHGAPGPTLVVVLCSYEVLYEALVKQAATFRGHPELTISKRTNQEDGEAWWGVGGRSGLWVTSHPSSLPDASPLSG